MKEEKKTRYKVPPKQFKTVAVPIEIWEDLWKLSETNQRSPAKQIEFLVGCASKAPTDREVQERYANLSAIIIKDQIGVSPSGGD